MNSSELSEALPAIEFANLRVHVLRALREGIIVGRIPQGSVLVETRLANQLNVSRGTVREALLELQQEQLVEVAPSGRPQVRTLDSRMVREIFEVRGALEGLAADLIARSPDRTEKQARLREQLSVFDEHRDGSMLDLVDADLSFHRTLCELSGNEMLLGSWRSLEGPLRMAIMHAGTERARVNITAEKHEPFVAALDEGVDHPGEVVAAALMATVDTLTTDDESSDRTGAHS